MDGKKSGAVARQYHLAVVEKKDAEIESLRAEVRRLRAMVELTQDARELAQLIRSHFRASMNQVSSTPGANPELDGAAQLISTYRARLLDEAAERIRAEKVDAEDTGDIGDIAYNYAIDDAIRALYEYAAVRGEVE